jgi:hypothetical protein
MTARARTLSSVAHPLVLPSLVLLAAFLLLAWEARQMYFFGDEWAFLLRRDITEDPLDALFAPHNEHWSTVPVLVLRTMYTLFGLDHYLAYALLPILAHLVTCALLYAALRLSGVGRGTALVVLAVMAFLGAGAENPLWVFQIGMIGSGMFVLAALVLVVRDLELLESRRGRVLVWVLCVLGLMSSGTAIPMMAWLAGYLVLRASLRTALVATVPPVIVYGVWYVAYGRHADAGLPESTLDQVLPLAWRGLVVTWDRMTGIEGAGVVFVLGLVVVSLVVAPRSPARALALSGVAAALATYVLLGHSRGGLGPDATTALRYSYFGALMTLPALALGLDALVARLPRRLEEVLVLAVVAGIFVVPGITMIDDFREGRNTLTSGLRQRLLGAAEIVGEGQPILREGVEPSYNPDISATALRDPDVRDALPDVDPGPRGLVDAAAALQVGASTEPFDLPGRRMELVGTALDKTDGCFEGIAAPGSTLDLPAGDEGAQLELTLLGTASTSVRIERGGVTSTSVPLSVTDSAPSYVGVVAPDSVLHVDLPPNGAFRACEVR